MCCIDRLKSQAVSSYRIRANFDAANSWTRPGEVMLTKNPASAGLFSYLLWNYRSIIVIIIQSAHVFFVQLHGNTYTTSHTDFRLEPVFLPGIPAYAIWIK